MLEHKYGVALFTDGSSYHKDRSGGWAWVAIDEVCGEESGSGHASDTTNNRMEMQAWIEGLNHLFGSFGPCDVLVYCDSQYVGYGAMDKSRTRRKNKDQWSKIDKAIEQHRSVEFIWVKGHHSSHFNHLVDKLAGEARKEGQWEQQKRQEEWEAEN